MTLPVPTQREESWRYSDVAALGRVWPATAAQIAPRDNEPVLTTLAAHHAALQTFMLKDGDRFVLPQSGGHTRIALYVPENVTASFVETLSGSGWLNHAVDIILGPRATLHHVWQQEREATALTTCTYTLSLAADARYQGFALNSGSAASRLHLLTSLDGLNAVFTLAGVQMGNRQQSLEIITQTRHEVRQGNSTQLIRTVVNDQAKGTYLGKIRVAPDAQKTDARQSSRAMLLARTATVNTKPELEIHADDVKCAHGATVGELDPQALFYMATRGIDPAEARALLIEAFMGDALETVADDTLRMDLAQRITHRLHAMVRGEA